MIEALYLDMDGVIADFDAALKQRGVFDDQGVFHHLPKEQWTTAQLKLDLAVRECMEALDFWPNIPLMEGARDLWQFASTFNLFVLTATPRETSIRSVIEKQKRAWIQRYFGPFPNHRIIVCQRNEKCNYARPGSVLIDDLAPNCKEWAAAGGTAILFKSVAGAIHRLTLLVTGEQQSAQVTPFPPPKVSEMRCLECHEPAGKHKLTCRVQQGSQALRPRNSAERKAEPIHSGVMKYFPDALAAVARISKAGNDKHNPGEPLHWARGKSMDQMDAAARHMLTLEEIDEQSKETEAAHNAWRALAQLQLIEERRLVRAGIRPYSGIVP